LRVGARERPAKIPGALMDTLADALRRAPKWLKSSGETVRKGVQLTLWVQILPVYRCQNGPDGPVLGASWAHVSSASGTFRTVLEGLFSGVRLKKWPHGISSYAMWRICCAPSRHYNPTNRQAGCSVPPPPESGPAFLSPAPVVRTRTDLRPNGVLRSSDAGSSIALIP